MHQNNLLQFKHSQYQIPCVTSSWGISFQCINLWYPESSDVSKCRADINMGFTDVWQISSNSVDKFVTDSLFGCVRWYIFLSDNSTRILDCICEHSICDIITWIKAHENCKYLIYKVVFCTFVSGVVIMWVYRHILSVVYVYSEKASLCLYYYLAAQDVCKWLDALWPVCCIRLLQ